MISIEAKKAVKEGAVIILVLFVLVAAMLTTEKDAYLAPPLELSLLLYASFIGWAMFDRERQEGAMEYLLSLPVSRIRLILIKFVPRAAAVLSVLFIYSFIHKKFAMHFLLTEFFHFAFFFLSVFLLSAALSLSMKSFLGTFFLTLFLTTGLYFLIKHLDMSRPDTAAAIQAALSLLLIPALFVVLFRKFDIKPLSYFNMKFAPSLVLIILFIFGVTYVFTGVEWTSRGLTADGYLISISGQKTVLQKEDKKIIFDNPIGPILEEQGILYGALSRGKLPGQLVKTDLKTALVENLYRAEPGWWFHAFAPSGLRVGRWLYFLLTSEDHKAYRIIGLSGDKRKEIPVKANFGKERIHLFHGAVDEPLQFFVFTGTRVFRVFENGESEFLFDADGICLRRNKLLVCNRDGITIYEVGGELTQVFEKKGDIKLIKRRFEDPLPSKILTKTGHEFSVFDMEKGTFTRINPPGLPYDYVTASQDGQLRILFVSGPEISIFCYKDGRLQSEKVIYSEIAPEGSRLRIIRVFPAGVVIQDQKDVEFYLFE